MSKTILLVDDEPGFHKIVTKILKTQGYTVLTASNGQEGLHALKTVRPDLILLDIMMPIMNGFEFFKLVRQNEKYTNIPIIIASARKLMKGTFVAMGADAFILKPFNSDELIFKIKFLLKDSVLVLCDYPHAMKRIKKALELNGYTGEFVSDERIMFKQGKVKRYFLLIVHLALLKKKPQSFLSKLNSLKYKNPRLLIYCDFHVKGAESKSTLPIERIERVWLDIGVEEFYDARTAFKPLPEMIKEWFGKAE